MTDTHHCTHHTPLGPVLLVGTADGLAGLFFEDHARPPRIGCGRAALPGELDDARRQLDDYFAGRRAAFELRLATVGTAFERRVWAALLEIPRGATTTYGALARRIGAPGAARAVGTANGRNPVSIIVPCHRVVGQDGSLTGYAGGLARKRALLQLEGVPAKAVVPWQPVHGRC